MSRRKKHRGLKHGEGSAASAQQPPDPATLPDLPITSQGIRDYFKGYREVNVYPLRRETVIRIERLTNRPLICYVSKTYDVPKGIPSHIDDSDIVAFGDLIQGIEGELIDIFIVSNGGSVETAERIVRMLRSRFRHVRFIVAGNAYSAATVMCFSGDEILMDSTGTLGPIDPQIDGIPARAILRAFETVEERLKAEGPSGLTAYMPLLLKYDLHLLEICKSAQELGKELAAEWLSQHMLKCSRDDPRVQSTVTFFSDFDERKSHGRSIGGQAARAQGLVVTDVESIAGLSRLVRSLFNQFVYLLDIAPFFKVFENSRGVAWGRRYAVVSGDATPAH